MNATQVEKNYKEVQKKAETELLLEQLNRDLEAMRMITRTIQRLTDELRRLNDAEQSESY